MTGMSVTSVRTACRLHADSQSVPAAQCRSYGLGMTMTMARRGNSSAGGKGTLTASAGGNRGESAQRGKPVDVDDVDDMDEAQEDAADDEDDEDEAGEEEWDDDMVGEGVEIVIPGE